MKVTWKKRFASALCAALLLGTMAGCGDQNAASSPSASNAPSASQSASTGGSEDPVTIKVFSNLTDRTTGQGLIEQTLFDNYMEENPNVTIEVEALDDESYKTKFKAYAAGSSMPDLVNIWCSPSFLDEVVEAGVLAELNAEVPTTWAEAIALMEQYKALHPNSTPFFTHMKSVDQAIMYSLNGRTGMFYNTATSSWDYAPLAEDQSH